MEREHDRIVREFSEASRREIDPVRDRLMAQWADEFAELFSDERTRLLIQAALDQAITAAHEACVPVVLFLPGGADAPVATAVRALFRGIELVFRGHVETMMSDDALNAKATELMEADRKDADNARNN